MFDYDVSNAQNREDIILSGFFKGVKKGFYVDVGANHPDTLSVTKFFYDRGWSGINIEPNPELFRELAAQRHRDTNLNIGAADKPGELTLREYPEGDGLSTFSTETQKQYRESSTYKKYTGKYVDRKVPVKPLSQVFEENGVEEINFMNVDVEGFEYEVLKGNDWKKYRPQVICIEANHINKDWRPLLKEAKYELVFNDGLNNYYVADEHRGLADEFSYAEAVLIRKPVLPAPADEWLKLQQVQISQLENKLIRADLVADKLHQEIDRLNNHIASQKRLRSLVKQLAFAINNIIMLNIEKLNKVKQRKLPPLQLAANLEAEQREAALHAYDLQAYYGVRQRQPVLYVIVKGIYLLIAKAVYKVLKSLMKLVRRGRRV